MGMNILLCSEWFFPSVGGIQSVIRELGESLVRRGHKVTVATTKLEGRTRLELNGIRIREFEAAGNMVLGIHGDVESYRRFVLAEPFDAILIYAAQQWTFDALWSVMSVIKGRKVHVPCGYASLYDPAYRDYYLQMPEVLKKIDHLVFNATEYRDIQFARENQLTHYSVIPNGAGESEFADPNPAGLREALCISKDDFVFLSVGSPPFAKGHQDVAQAYAQISLPFPSTLILDGRYEPQFHPFNQGPWNAARLWGRKMILWLISRREQEAWKLFQACRHVRRQPLKRVLITDMPRSQIVAAFFSADLFVFASKVDYSPLVLFESAAAGLPFLSVPVGNADEIVHWTKCGEICPAKRDLSGRTQVVVSVLAGEMQRLATNRELLTQLGQQGRENWRRHFTWEKIVDKYEEILGTTRRGS